MTKACPVPTPAERLYGSIQSRAETAMMEAVHVAVRMAAAQARAEIEAAGLAMPPPALEYFTAVVHQQMFCTLCGADPADFAGGRAEIATAIIRNSQNIARHYWGADV